MGISFIRWAQKVVLIYYTMVTKLRLACPQNWRRIKGSFISALGGIYQNLVFSWDLLLHLFAGAWNDMSITWSVMCGKPSFPRRYFNTSRLSATTWADIIKSSTKWELFPLRPHYSQAISLLQLFYPFFWITVDIIH